MVRRATAMVVMLLALASCGASSKDSVAQQPPAAVVAPVTASDGGTGAEADGSACALRDIGLSFGEDPTDHATGEHSASLRFTNDGEQTCVLDGRPFVEFLDADGHPFVREDENGAGGGYVHKLGKATVQLRPGSSADVVIAKFRCDFGVEAVATQVKVGLPGAADTVTLVTDPNILSWFTSCRGDDDDPGQTFAISGYTPFECRVVGNETGGGWCDGDLERPHTQTVEEAEWAAEKLKRAREHSLTKSG